MAKRKSKSSSKTKLKPAQVIDGGRLGELKLTGKLTPTYFEYTAQCKFGRKAVELNLYSDEFTGDMDVVIGHATYLIRNFKQAKAGLDAYIATEVLDMVNTHYRADRPLTAIGLQRALKLDGIIVHATGKASFSYDPDDLLMYHHLVLFGNVQGEVYDMDTPG